MQTQHETLPILESLIKLCYRFIYLFRTLLVYRVHSYGAAVPRSKFKYYKQSVGQSVLGN